MALSGNFVSAGGSLDAAEMTQMQRKAPVLPPPCNLCLPLLYWLSF
ncbi:MAG: hypothetical protein ABI970_00055 [Chloroflexota bacterium]|nr:hypothetical protein [Anaerolineae bacterium]